MTSLDHILRSYPYPFLTDNDMALLLDGSDDSRYGKVKRLMVQNKLIPLRRGLYFISETIGHSSKPHPFELAQHIYEPSYISLESALSFHENWNWCQVTSINKKHTYNNF